MIRAVYRRIVPTTLRDRMRALRVWSLAKRKAFVKLMRDVLFQLRNPRLATFHHSLRRPPSYPKEVWNIEMNPTHLRRHAWLSRVVRGTVLDSGCGRGIATCSIARFAASVHGVDFDEKKIEVLNDLIRLNGIRNVTFQTGDAYRLPVGDDSFDTVTLLEVIEHLEQPQDAVAEALRVARRRVVITVPAHGHMTQVPGHIQDFTPEDLKAMLPHDGTVQWTECLPFQFVLFKYP